MMIREWNLYSLNMIDIIVAYMIGCGDTLPRNYLSPLIFTLISCFCFDLISCLISFEFASISVIDFSKVDQLPSVRPDSLYYFGELRL